MENITLGEIATIITFLSVFIGAIISLLTFSKKFIKKILKPIDEKIDRIEKGAIASRNNIEIELIKIILVNYMNDIEQGNQKSGIQKKNAYELYDRYKELGGNSYIHDSWEKLMKEGKI